jgi:hypothetical protein
MRTNACEQRSRLHLQLRMHILRRLRRGTELRLSKLRRRAGAAARAARSRLAPRSLMLDSIGEKTLVTNRAHIGQ